jgi:hypothetical protein
VAPNFCPSILWVSGTQPNLRKCCGKISFGSETQKVKVATMALKYIACSKSLIGNYFDVFQQILSKSTELQPKLQWRGLCDYM